MIKYSCPMECEGTKTYDKPGYCPVCKMHLVPVNGHKGHIKHHHEKTQSFHDHAIYTCPMHPEVKSHKPGSCPKCGMNLVPEKGIDTSDEEYVYKKMTQKFWTALALSIPVFIIS